LDSDALAGFASATTFALGSTFAVAAGFASATTFALGSTFAVAAATVAAGVTDDLSFDLIYLFNLAISASFSFNLVS